MVALGLWVLFPARLAVHRVDLLNSSRINTVIENFGPSLHQPTAILQPRLLRLAMQMRF
jgi:hypothetical protein